MIRRVYKHIGITPCYGKEAYLIKHRMSDENLPQHLKNVPPQLRKAVDDLVQKSSKGLGVTHKQKPVCVMLPPEADVVVKAMPNRSDFIRAAVIEKLDREHSGETEKTGLEEIRDRILMKKPPKERGKLRAVLNEFIEELRTREGSQG